MHHFCSHVIAQTIGKDDFGDKCFCSVACYDPSKSNDHSGEPDLEEKSAPLTLEEEVVDSGESKEEEETRIVEWIQDRKYKGKKTQYLIKWKDDDEMTWESVSKLDHCKDLLAQFDFRTKLGKKCTVKASSEMSGCHLCGDEDGVTRECEKSGVDMHQLCTNQLAVLVGLSDFEEECFCSTQCYDAYISTKLVAFAPEDEEWGKRKYPLVGHSFLVGRICRRSKRKADSRPLYEVRWLETAFNSKVEYLDSATLARGRKHYNLLDVEDDADDDIADDIDTSSYVQYDPQQVPPASLKEVELLESMYFDPNESMEAPKDLFEREDGSTDTNVKERFKPVFQSSAAASFFAYLPVSFWKQVVEDTNAYQCDLGLAFGGYGVQSPFTLKDLMTFFGILFYMRLFPRGEYRTYWGKQQENEVLQAGANINLDHKMPLKRFKALRASLCFTHGVTLAELGLDPVAKIRNLVNMLKKTGPRYIHIGRNIAIDESTISCRTRYARRLICFNPRKPGGKFHFKIYMACCATTWIALNYKLDTKDSQAEYRLGGVIPAEEILAFKEDTEHCSKTRADVLEVLRPFYGSKIIVNMDNYYTSMLLLEAIKLKGMYARGTVKAGSKHFPKHVMLSKADKCTRGDFRQGVCVENQSLAASWWDGNAVTMISNADPSTMATVQRAVRMEKSTVKAPVCIKEYNKYMQGVDRLDQLLKRFALSGGGHNFRKWHKQLAMAVIDIARCNAYLTWKMARDTSKSRDPHRDFVVELATQLLSGEWEELAPDDNFYNDDEPDLPPTPMKSPIPMNAKAKKKAEPVSTCKFVASAHALADKSWKARQCAICKYEGKNASVVTVYCQEHTVSLCAGVHPTHTPKEDFFCPNQEWSCWKKFHEFYLPKRIFNDKGHVRKGSILYLKKLTSMKELALARQEARRGGFMDMLLSPQSSASTDYCCLTPTSESGSALVPLEQVPEEVTEEETGVRRHLQL